MAAAGDLRQARHTVYVAAIVVPIRIYPKSYFDTNLTLTNHIPEQHIQSGKLINRYW